MATRFLQAQEGTVVTGIGTSETEIVISGLKTISGDNITQDMIGGPSDYVAMTLSPKTSREEQVLAQVVSEDGDNVTFNIIRAVNPVYPYEAGGGIAQPHNVLDTVVISNNPALFNKLAAKDNDETVTGDWDFDGDNTFSGDNTFQGETTFTDVVDTTNTVLKVADAVDTDEPYTKGQADSIFETKSDATSKDGQNVKLTGNQTIAGVKTFSSSPVVPTGSSATNAVNKAQMESYIAANSGDVKASTTAFGTVKLDVAADDVAEPKAYSATTNRVNALAGGGIFGTPSGSNKFVTEDKLEVSDGFGTGADGDIILDGTNTYSSLMTKSGSEYTLTSDINAQNLTVTSPAILNTNGYVIYVKNTLTGNGTIRHSDPAIGVGGNGGNGAGATSDQGSGGGGGGGAAGGIVLIFASVLSGTFAIESVGSNGGNGGNNSGGSGPGAGGSGGTARGAGRFKGLAGGAGGQGLIGTNTGNPGNNGSSPSSTFSLISAGASGGKGNSTATDNVQGGNGGSGGSATVPPILPDAARFLAWLFLGLSSSNSLVDLHEIPGSGGGGSGGSDSSPDQSAAGAGGGGGNGGYAFVFYKRKDWSGTTNFSGGLAGAQGTGGNIGTVASAGTAGALFEVDWSHIK